MDCVFKENNWNIASNITTMGSTYPWIFLLKLSAFFHHLLTLKRTTSQTKTLQAIQHTKEWKNQNWSPLELSNYAI